MIYLIGGAPCTGKTTLAKVLATKLGIPVLGTDTIREWMQKILNREEYPELFHAVDLSAEEYLMDNSHSEIVQKEIAQQKIVAKGILAFIETNYDWSSYVIEGTGITPELIKNVQATHTDVSSLVVIDKDSDRIRRQIFQRGLWSDPQSYSNELKEIEVQWVLAFSSWYESESKRLGIPYVQLEDQDSVISEALDLLNVR